MHESHPDSRCCHIEGPTTTHEDRRKLPRSFDRSEQALRHSIHRDSHRTEGLGPSTTLAEEKARAHSSPPVPKTSTQRLSNHMSCVTHHRRVGRRLIQHSFPAQSPLLLQPPQRGQPSRLSLPVHLWGSTILTSLSMRECVVPMVEHAALGSSDEV